MCHKKEFKLDVNISISELDELPPWEREVYLILFKEKIRSIQENK